MQNYHNYHVDLSNCDSEPIHLIGRIQPHGFLLVLDPISLQVEQASKNVGDYLPLALEQVLGKPLRNLFGPADTSFDPQVPGTYFLSLSGTPFVAFLQKTGSKLLLECEPAAPCPDAEKMHQNTLLSQLHNRLNALFTLEEVAEAVAHTLREILQYDRVDITRFDQEWNSDVIAESCAPDVPSFVGHHFPATDIPAPARELLRQKHVRQIPDVNAQAVEIFPYYNPGTGEPTNILRSELRNPSEIHLEYLRNAGVAATISFSILVKNQLWGVVACHNIKPAYIEVWRRQLGDLVAKTLGTVIASIMEKRDHEQFNQYRQVKRTLVKRLGSGLSIPQGLFGQTPTLLEITESHGAALLLDGALTTVGHTPPQEEIRGLVKWLSEQVSEGVFFTRQLSVEWPAAAALKEVASGLLALEISRYNQEYLLFFKPEIKEIKAWAGNPQKPQVGEGLRLHPRKSFEKWEEVIKGKSLPWTQNEVEVAQMLLKDLIAIRLRNQAAELHSLNQELQLNADQLRTRNAQLKDFAYIIAHNLRAPLANIKALHQYYTDEPVQERAVYAMESVKRISDNIGETIEDVNVILKTHLVQQLLHEEVSLAELIEKETQNLAATIEQTGAQVVTELEVLTLFMPRLYVESILHNFISNALKYRSPDRPPVVRVKSWRTGNTLHLAVSDNGLGMDLNKVGDKLFGLYKVFHRTEHSKGLGLYLTNMQVKALGGSITVDSQVGKGTTFTVHFGQMGHSQIPGRATLTLLPSEQA
ncbi:ATP-binding protein [Rufibacter glacialis]|uniref:histidine kinase n=1 Tax=Rufibacter glacialis TaxID=1259555 RepID=A0A5M8QS74_9BACT|nr:ATP-binding protein [Rufibacter glacialis]KAA6438118.1 GAF domain-containing protein [Rufibacter glacialis]GGK88741.1 histidine kinase [Rufibacter glacialis]